MSQVIEKQTSLKAPRSRVWRALTDSQEFGAWFGMKLEGPFRAGHEIKGSIQPTTVDAEVAKAQAPYAGKPLSLFVDRIEPETLFSFRWNPGGIDPNFDPAKEPMTLITFTLDVQGDGTLLKLKESGFENLPEARRADAYRLNDGGWTAQMKLIEKYVARG